MIFKTALFELKQMLQIFPEDSRIKNTISRTVEYDSQDKRFCSNTGQAYQANRYQSALRVTATVNKLIHNIRPITATILTYIYAYKVKSKK
jgi:hypothetical protein